MPPTPTVEKSFLKTAVVERILLANKQSANLLQVKALINSMTKAWGIAVISPLFKQAINGQNHFNFKNIGNARSWFYSLIHH